MADVVKDTLNISARQRKVIFQQKKPVLNYELNLSQDILKESIEELTRVSIGDNYSGDAFKVTPGVLDNEVIVKKGTFYHKGVPISFTADKKFSVDLPPLSGSRTDVLYVVWKIDQVNGAIDPAIGFVTTQEHRVSVDLVYESGTIFPTEIQQEQITFIASEKKITLSNGFFPDWLRIEGTVFKTSAIKNVGSPFFTVVSSPDNKTIIVEQDVVDEVSSDVRFTFYDSSLEIPKEFHAYRENFFVIANIERHSGVELIRDFDITDCRDSVSHNFVVSGCSVSSTGDLHIAIDSGEFLVGSDDEFLELTPWNGSVLDNSFNYVYLNKQGQIEVSGVEPTEFHVMLAEVQSKDSAIINLKDVRQFKPASWRDIYNSGGGTGPTGSESIFHNFTSGENISKYDAIFMDSDGKVKRASATSLSKIPVIGIAIQDTSLNEINNFLTFGEITNPAWNWTPGEMIFADSVLGKLTNSVGVESISSGQFVQRVGVAISAKKVLIKPDNIFVKKDSSAEVPLLTLRENGKIEVMGSGDRLNVDRLSSLATVAKETPSQKVDILPGRYFVEGNKAIDFSGQEINLGLAGTTYKTSAIPANFYNKAFFTLDTTGTVKMYEGVSSASVPALDPVIPDGEIPLSIVLFQDDGSAIDGSIINLHQEDITDKRSWLNLGSSDNSCFRAIYRNDSSVLIEKGSAWFGKDYVSLNQNIYLNVVSSDGDYFVYLNMNNTLGSGLNITANSSSFLATTLPPTQVDRRKFIPLASYSVLGGLIDRSSFRTFKSKYWDYRDTPYTDEQIFSIITPMDTLSITNFDFVDGDYLDIKINGLEVFENYDYTKDGTLNTINFGYQIKQGASVRVRRV